MGYEGVVQGPPQGTPGPGPYMNNSMAQNSMAQMQGYPQQNNPMVLTFFILSPF